MVFENREKSEKNEFRKIRKTAVSFNIKLTNEQKEAKRIMMDPETIVAFLKGKPGTSKTTVCANVALDLKIKGYVDKIIVTRPTVIASKEMGFLPGEAFDFKKGKLAPFLAPVLQAFYKLRDKKEIDLMIEKEEIEVIPIQFARGHNFENAIVLVDEAQNLTVEELKVLTTRISKNCKMFFTSDVNQIDLHNKNNSSAQFIDNLTKLQGVEVITLTENFRHPLAIQIMDELVNDQIDKSSGYKSEE